MPTAPQAQSHDSAIHSVHLVPLLDPIDPGLTKGD